MRHILSILNFKVSTGKCLHPHVTQHEASQPPQTLFFCFFFKLFTYSLKDKQNVSPLRKYTCWGNTIQYRRYFVLWSPDDCFTNIINLAFIWWKDLESGWMILKPCVHAALQHRGVPKGQWLSDTLDKAMLDFDSDSPFKLIDSWMFCAQDRIWMRRTNEKNNSTLLFLNLCG